MTKIMPTSRPRVLTIDDDDMMRLMLEDILAHEGFEISSAANGQAGLELFRQKRPELVLLDVMMPGMDGYACLEALRAMPEANLLPIVMLTGADDVESVHRSFDLGATDFIAKPFNWPTLPYRLRYMIRASQALSDLAHSEAVLRNAQKIAHLGNWEWEINTDRLSWSAEVFNILGVPTDEFQGKQLDLFKTVHASDAPMLYQSLNLCMKHGHPFALEIRAVHPNHTVHLVHIQGEAEQQQGTPLKIHGTVQDITERRRIEEQIRFLSYYDTLTGLPNRTLFKEILGQAICACDRYEASLATLFVGIERFKRINETLGPAVGDRLLQLFAERLVRFLRESDFIAVATDFTFAEAAVSRLSSSEFTVMLNPIRDTRDSVKVAKRIFQWITTPFEVEGHEIFLEVNIGIAVYPGDGPDVDTFIKNGEFAMNHAREQGQNSHQFFNKTLNAAAFHKLAMESSLRRAIERNELMLYYQPKVDLQSNQVVGMEALVRWLHPEFGLVLPTQFIPVAEDSGLIGSISEWILSTVCRQLRAWQQDGMPQLVAAINISAMQFNQKDFLPYLRKTLNHTGLTAGSLKLELTESILLDNVSEALATLRELRTLGIQISIDDFGTGYSSLAYLKKLPISELKIDRSFIRDIPHSDDDRAIVSAIIAMAKALSLQVVAEGVENEQQIAFLRNQGCDMVQGYFYSKPLALEEFREFVLKFHQRNN